MGNDDGTNDGNKCIKVECRTHEHCNQKKGHQKCVANKCEKVGCITNAHCGDLAVCLANTCKDVQCKTNGDCSSSFVCRNQTCEKVGCTVHDDCTDDEDKPYCKRNKCVPMPRLLDIIH